MSQDTMQQDVTPFGAAAAIGLALAVLSLGLNVSVIATCFDGANACDPLTRWIPNLDVIPYVHKPVDYLLAHGNAARAEMVRQAYSYTWVASLLEMALIASVMIWRFLRLPAATLRALAQTPVFRRKLEASDNVVPLALTLMLLFIGWAAWGFFIYEGYQPPRHSYRFTFNLLIGNSVYAHDSELYQLAVILFLAVLCGIWALTSGARAYLHRRYTQTVTPTK